MSTRHLRISSLLGVAVLSLLTGAARAQMASAPPAGAFYEKIDRELAVKGGLTAEELASRAVTTSYGVDARRNDALAARENLSKAKAGYVPKVTLQARYTRLSNIGASSLGNLVTAPDVAAGGTVDPNTNTLIAIPVKFPQILDQYAFTAGLAVPVSDYFLRVAKAEGAAEFSKAAAEHDVTYAERAAATDARGLYYAWVGSRLATLIAEEALEQAKAANSDVKAAAAAGTASRADELRIEALVAERERTVASARHSEADYEERVRILRHDPPGTHYVIGEDIRGEPPALGMPEQQQELVAFAMTHRPDLMALTARANAVSRSADVERAGMYPRLDLFANANYSNPNQRIFPQQEAFHASWDAGAQLTWVVTDLVGASASTKAADASAAAIRAQAKAQEDQVRREVSAALQDVLDARAAIGTSQTSLRAAEESYRVRRALFQNGRSTSTELLDTELELNRARLTALTVRLQYRVSRARLEYAIGRGEARPG